MVYEDDYVEYFWYSVYSFFLMLNIGSIVRWVIFLVRVKFVFGKLGFMIFGFWFLF